MTDVRTVALTGGSGFLGAAIHAAAPPGCQIVSLGRAATDTPWDIRWGAQPELPPVSAIVHCAWITAPRDAATAEANVAASLALLRAARITQARFVFISSMSASPSTHSRYGRAKLAVEHEVASYPLGHILRPGTVQSPTGSVGMLDETLARIAGLPLSLRLRPDPQVPIVALSRVVDAVWSAVTHQVTAPSPELLVDTWADLGVLVEQRRRTRARLTLPVSPRLLSAGARVGQALPLTAVRDPADSWLGLVEVRRPAETAPDPSEPASS